MKTTHTPMNLCPHCGHTVDAASDFRSNKSPQPGDISICIACGGLSLFDADLRQRLPTKAELREIAKNPHVARARFAIRMGQKEFGEAWAKEKKRTQ